MLRKLRAFLWFHFGVLPGWIYRESESLAREVRKAEPEVQRLFIHKFSEFESGQISSEELKQWCKEHIPAVK